MGAPPVDWWLDDYMRWLGRPYYLALQSAAMSFGSSRQAIQETQVITDVVRPQMVIGRIRLHFFMKAAIRNSITQQLPGAYAPLVVATPETTLFDLVRYSHKLGGIERVAETIKPILSLVKEKSLRLMLDAEHETAVAQRLGFILDVLGADRLTGVVLDWLPMRLQKVMLSPHVGGDEASPVDRKWNVANNSGSFA